MLLQLQADGMIENLDAIPAAHSFHFKFTFWFKEFIEGYYEETHQPYTAKHYTEYSNRMKKLWDNRPDRPYDKFNSLIGKTVEKEGVGQEKMQENIGINQINIQCAMVSIPEELPALTVKAMKKLKNNQDFMPKPSTSYGLTTFMSKNRYRDSSDEEQNNDGENTLQTTFDSASNVWLFRKIVLRNQSNESILAVLTLKPGQNCNLLLPKSPLSLDVRSESVNSVILIKKDPTKDYGDIEIQVKTLGKSTRPGYWPRQILTPAEAKPDTSPTKEDRKNSDDEDSDNLCFVEEYYVFGSFALYGLYFGINRYEYLLIN